MEKIETRTVTIPAYAEHAGLHSLTLTLPWICMYCRGKRGEPFETLSYDGSRRLGVHGWTNPCGHVETYSEIRESLLANLGASPRPEHQGTVLP